MLEVCAMLLMVLEQASGYDAQNLENKTIFIDTITKTQDITFVCNEYLCYSSKFH